MSSPAPAKQQKSATKPRQKIEGHTDAVRRVLCLSGGHLIITCSLDGSLRVWNLESGTQVGEAWKDEESGGVRAIALSPDNKKVASRGEDGAVRLWDIDTSKVIKKWTGQTTWGLGLWSVSWSPDGGQVMSGSWDGTFSVCNVERGETILGPLETGDNYAVWAVCYSPDGELITTVELGSVGSLAWTEDGNTLIVGALNGIRKFDTSTWTATAVLLVDQHDDIFEPIVNGIALSPNERILASASCDEIVRLWDLRNNQPIGQPLHHEKRVESVAFSIGGTLLITGGYDQIYTWDVSDILGETCLDDLLSDNNAANKSVLNADARRRAPQIEDTRRIPRGFFDDVNFPTSRPSERDAGRPLSRAQHFVSGILHRRNGSDMELREPRVVDVPYTAAKPRNYHARKDSCQLHSPSQYSYYAAIHENIAEHYCSCNWNVIAA